MKRLIRFIDRIPLAIGLLLSLGLIFGGVWAAASSGPIAIDAIQRWMKGGLYVGASATNSTANKVTNSGAGRCSYDYPAIGGKSDSLLPLCAVTFACALSTGSAAVGDPCLVAANFGADGGADIDVAVDLTCRVTAPDTVKGKACVHMSDAGTIDLADAGYFYRTFSNQ